MVQRQEDGAVVDGLAVVLHAGQVVGRQQDGDAKFDLHARLFLRATLRSSPVTITLNHSASRYSVGENASSAIQAAVPSKASKPKCCSSTRAGMEQTRLSTKDLAMMESWLLPV